MCSALRRNLVNFRMISTQGLLMRFSLETTFLQLRNRNCILLVKLTLTTAEIILLLSHVVTWRGKSPNTVLTALRKFQQGFFPQWRVGFRQIPTTSCPRTYSPILRKQESSGLKLTLTERALYPVVPVLELQTCSEICMEIMITFNLFQYASGTQ